MKNMPETKAAAFKNQCKKEDRRTTLRRLQLDYLRDVEGYEKATQRDIPKARKAGVLPSIEHDHLFWEA